jgi:hypothetical protein
VARLACDGVEGVDGVLVVCQCVGFAAVAVSAREFQFGQCDKVMRLVRDAVNRRQMLQMHGVSTLLSNPIQGVTRQSISSLSSPPSHVNPEFLMNPPANAIGAIRGCGT